MRISRAGRLAAAVAYMGVIAVSAEAGPRQSGDETPVVSRRPAAVTAGETCGAENGQLPVNVQIDRRMVPHVSTMLSRSLTFRDQCVELAQRPWVYVRVLLKHDELLHGMSAQSVIRRTTAGHLLAFVDVGWRSDWSEWLAHEFEHVLEQADGGSMAAFKVSAGTWPSGENAFETVRAIAAGRDVRAEVRFTTAVLQR